MFRRIVLPAIFLAAWMMACKSEKAREGTGEMEPDAIFHDYQVNGSEDTDSVTVLLYFREYDAYGYGLHLDTPATIQLDGRAVPGYTLEIPGSYYELNVPAASFTGNHTIRFTDRKGQAADMTFHYQPFQLVSALPATITGDSLFLQFGGVDSGDVIHVVMTDTAYASEGVEKLDTLRGDRLTISAGELAELAPGPVQLELIRETSRELGEGGRMRGQLRTSYHIKRELTLQPTGKKLR